MSERECVERERERESSEKACVRRSVEEES